MSSEALVSDLFGTRDQFCRTFSMDRVREGGGFVMIQHITCVVHFISIIITSAPPQITRPQIPKAGDPSCEVPAGNGEEQPRPKRYSDTSPSSPL